MPHAENTVTVDRPIDDVFAYLADGANNPRWRSGVVSIERTSTVDGAGATYRQKLRGPAGRTGRFTLTEAGPGRTTVTFTLDLQPTGLMRLMNAMIAKTMRSEVNQLSQLKADLEKTT